MKRTKEDIRTRIHRRIRKRMSGTADRPRLAIFRSQAHIYAQVINDESGTTVCTASSLDEALKKDLKRGATVAAAKAVGKLIACETLKKVGFGLSDDLRRIPIKFHVQPKAVLDLETLFVKKGYGRGVGVKVAVAIVFKRRFLKSKKASTSDWSRPLNEKQILYAANDAYAAIKVYDALKEK